MESVSLISNGTAALSQMSEKLLHKSGRRMLRQCSVVSMVQMYLFLGIGLVLNSIRLKEAGSMLIREMVNEENIAFKG